MTYVPVNFGIVSPAQWGRLLLNSVQESSKLKFGGVWGRNQDNAQDITAHYGGMVYDSYHALLADEAIEAVLLPTPHFLHYSQTMEALQMGKHVFVEKPIANHLHEAHDMQRLSIERNLVLSVGLGGRRTGGARILKQKLDSGEYGDVAMVVVMHGSPQVHVTYQPGDWETSSETMPGGILDQLGVHYAEVLRYLFGPVRRVAGFYNAAVSQYDTVDVASLSYEFESGRVALHALHQVSAYISQMNVFTTRGMFQMNRMGRELLWHPIADLNTAKKGGAAVQTIPVDGPEMTTTVLQEELEEFADCIRLGSKPEVGAEEGIAALRLMRAAMKAHESKTVVDLQTDDDLS